MRQDYKDDVDLDGALKLAVEVLSKTMDSTSLDSEKGASWLSLAALLADIACLRKVELATLVLDQETGQPTTHVLSPAEIDDLLKKHGLAKTSTEGDAAPGSTTAQAANTDMQTS